MNSSPRRMSFICGTNTSSRRMRFICVTRLKLEVAAMYLNPTLDPLAAGGEETLPDLPAYPVKIQCIKCQWHSIQSSRPLNFLRKNIADIGGVC